MKTKRAYLLVHDGAESCLSLDYGVRNLHLAAKRRDEDDKLDGIHIVGNEDQGRLLVLDQGHNVVQAILDHVRLLADLLLLPALSDGRSLDLEPLLLIRLGFRAILVQELQDLGRSVAIKDVLKLGDGWWDFEAHQQDLLLALQANIFGPSHHAREVAPRLDVLADAEVTGTALDQRVLASCQIIDSSNRRGCVRSDNYLGLLLVSTGLALREGRGSRLLSSFGRLSLRKDQHQRIMFTMRS